MNSSESEVDGDSIYLRDVSAGVSGRPILADISLSMHPGEIHLLVGKQNGGKSAICAVLTGDIRPDSGVVSIDGRELPYVTRRQARAAGIATVARTPRVFPRLTVGENLLSGEPSWWRSLRSWRGYLHEMRAWLDAAGIDLNFSTSMDALPMEDWVFIEALSRLFRSPRLLIMDETLENLSPLRKRQFLSLLRRALEKGMAAVWITHKVEDAMLLADRLSVVRNGRILLTSRPESLDRLNLIQLCYAQLDEIEEVDATRHQFHQLMRFTNALIRDLPLAVAILDPELNIRFINRQAATLFGVAETSVIGRKLGRLLGEANNPLAERVLSEMAVGGDREWHNLPVRLSGGEILSDVTLRRIFENGICVGFMLIMEDVSAREEVRSRLVLSGNLASIGLLAAGVAHEVNNPLEIIANYLSYLRARADSDNSRRVLAKIEDETTRIQQIVNNLIVYSGGPAAAEIVDMRALASELCGLLEFHNRNRKVKCLCGEAPEAMLVWADPNEIRQVLLNLFKNSLEAVGDGGEIRIDFETRDSPAGRQAVTLFRDNGSGIKLDNPADVFLPFVTTRRTGGKNHGLGLFISYGVIDKYGGVLAVENILEGGCLFTISLPLHSPGAALEPDTPFPEWFPAKTAPGS